MIKLTHPKYFSKYKSQHPVKFYISIVAIAMAMLFFILNFIFPFKVQQHYSPVYYASDSTILHVKLSKDDKWRIKTSLDEITPILKKAILAKEDQYFYYHYGFNPVSIVRAAFFNLLKLKTTSGASTITMQVVRMLEPRKRTYLSKMVELFRAVQLENQYSKDEILQLYLNYLPYGGNIEGVKSAALIYYKRNTWQLSLSQVITLTIIPNKPNSLRPDRHPEALREFRDLWIYRFLSNNIFNKTDLVDAQKEVIQAKRNLLPKKIPHLVRRIKTPKTENYLTVQSQIQEKVEHLVKNYSKRLSQFQIHNAAVLIIDNKTGAIVSYVGSQDFEDKNYWGEVDGVKAVRSPGSTLKPLVYGLGIDKGLCTPKTILNDIPKDFNGYCPENFDKKFNGKVTVAQALAFSLNIPAVEMTERVTVFELVQLLKKANFKTIVKQEKQLGHSIVLGGCGVSLEEMCNLYYALAQKGKWKQNYFQNQTKDTTTIQLLSPSATYLIHQILNDIQRPDLPNNAKNNYHIPQISWKTGTSYGRRDAWSIGYNSRYTVGVWLGNFDNSGVHELSGAETATPLMFEIFNNIDYNSSAMKFHKPEELKLRYVCAQTGKVPSENCNNQLIDLYIPLISSSEVCNHLHKVFLNPEETISYCMNCLPENGYKTKIFEMLSPELLHWYEQEGVPYDKIPIHNPHCQYQITQSIPKIISLSSDKEYLIEKNTNSKLELRAEVHHKIKNISWYINDSYLITVPRNEGYFFIPENGLNKISCVDDHGGATDLLINVKYF